MFEPIAQHQYFSNSVLLLQFLTELGPTRVISVVTYADQWGVFYWDR